MSKTTEEKHVSIRNYGETWVLCEKDGSHIFESGELLIFDTIGEAFQHAHDSGWRVCEHDS